MKRTLETRLLRCLRFVVAAMRNMAWARFFFFRVILKSWPFSLFAAF